MVSLIFQSGLRCQYSTDSVLDLKIRVQNLTVVLPNFMTFSKLITSDPKFHQMEHRNHGTMVTWGNMLHTWYTVQLQRGGAFLFPSLVSLLAQLWTPGRRAYEFTMPPEIFHWQNIFPWLLGRTAGAEEDLLLPCPRVSRSTGSLQLGELPEQKVKLRNL